MAKKELHIPLDKNGHMLRYDMGVSRGHWQGTDKYIENHEWTDTLRYSTYGRGRSAAYFEFKSILTKKIYYMFMTDLNQAIGFMTGGILMGTFTYTKRGKNFGIKLVKGIK